MIIGRSWYKAFDNDFYFYFSKNYVLGGGVVKPDPGGENFIIKMQCGKDSAAALSLL